MSSSFFEFLRFLVSWKVAAAILAILNLKNLPFAWHYRFFRLLGARLIFSPSSRQPDYHALFLPAITRSHAPMLETDYNIHKSNSTYLSDVDMSRGNLGVLLFRNHMANSPYSSAPRFMLGGVVCVWKREIKSYKTYEMWSRTLSWDDKWLYVLTTFVESGVFKPRKYYMQKEQPAISSSGTVDPKILAEKQQKAIYASAISRIVFKQGRQTVPPIEMIKTAGLAPPADDKNAWDKMEEWRSKRLGIGQLKEGWDAVHGLFFEETDEVLGRYTDLLWR